jgi:DNA-binding NarL/FixJ family response regulator
MRPTVLIVDDHAEFRASASALLESEGFDVIGEAADGEAAISASERLRPEGQTRANTRSEHLLRR